MKTEEAVDGLGGVVECTPYDRHRALCWYKYEGGSRETRRFRIVPSGSELLSNSKSYNW